uniref:Uncharacterized protein n=1 Tax=Rhizophagus irregularis (strain DAOM 181602 / DAOM 197198 / MUCL 43194) TaxID=747089 RepID=U9UTS4_RHIID
MTMKASSTSQMQNVFKEKIEALKEETSNLIEEIAGYAGDGNTNEFLRSLGNLESKLMDIYKTMDSLSNRVDEVEKELKELKDQLGGVDNWHGVEMGLHYHNLNEPLTKKESGCVERLMNLLKDDEDIGLSLTDIKDAEMELGTYPVPDDLKIYKPPLKKAFKAMSRWRSS